MKRHHILLVMLTLSSLFVGPAAIGAQDAVTCDATLTTLLAVAMWDYGYQPSVDLSAYDFGQYTDVMQAASVALAEASAALEAAEGAVDQAQDAAGEAIQDVADAAGQVGVPAVGEALEGAAEVVEEAGEQAVEAAEQALANAASSVQLASGIVQGENVACAVLRVELETFFAAQFAEKLAKEQ